MTEAELAAKIQPHITIDPSGKDEDLIELRCEDGEVRTVPCNGRELYLAVEAGTVSLPDGTKFDNDDLQLAFQNALIAKTGRCVLEEGYHRAMLEADSPQQADSAVSGSVRYVARNPRGNVSELSRTRCCCAHRSMSREEGVVYMLCFADQLGDTDRPRMSARHYVGWYANPQRIEHHANGTSGVAIVYAFFKRGIPFTVSRTMTGTRADERRIKRAGNHERNCPNCREKPGRGGWRDLHGED